MVLRGGLKLKAARCRFRLLIRGKVKFYGQIFSAPVQGALMGIKEQVNAGRAFYFASSIFHHTPSVIRYMHYGSDGVITGVCGDGSECGLQIPGKEGNTDWNHPGAYKAVGGKQAGFGFTGFCAAGGFAGIGFTLLRAFTDIVIPEV